MAMPSARGLFHKAIVQSATPFTTNARTMEFSARHTAALVRELNVSVDPVEALRKVPADALRVAYARTWGQVEFEIDAIARWSRLTSSDLRQIDPRQTDAPLGVLLQDRYGWDSRRGGLEVARFSSRKYSDNNGPIADGRVILEAPFGPVPAPSISARRADAYRAHASRSLGPNSVQARELFRRRPQAEVAELPTPVPRRRHRSTAPSVSRRNAGSIFAQRRTLEGFRYRIDAWFPATPEPRAAAPCLHLHVRMETNVFDSRPRAFIEVKYVRVR